MTNYLGTDNNDSLYRTNVENNPTENFDIRTASNDINTIIQEMTTFSADKGINITSINEVKNNTELMNLISNSWHS